MANNISVTEGSGKTVKTTDVAGEQIQNIIVTDATGTEIDWTAPVEMLGTGAAGTPATGVVTIQGITSGTNVPVSQATAASLNATVIGAGSAGTANAGVLTIQGIASMTPVQVSQATAANLNATTVGSGPVANGTAQAGSLLGGAVYNTTKPTLTNGQQAAVQAGTRGAVIVQLADPDGVTGITGRATNADGAAVSSTSFALQTWSYGATFNGTTWDRQKKANAVSRIVSSANSTNATSGKGSAGDVHVICCENTNAAVRYLKLYNKATAPTVGTDTPVMTIALPATSTFELSFPNGGVYFSTGIAYALTTGSADADTGAVGAGDILGLNVVYD